MSVNFSEWGFSEEEWEDFRLLTQNSEEFELAVSRSVAFWKDLREEIRDRQLSCQLFLFHTVSRILKSGTQTGISRRVLLAFGLAIADFTAAQLRSEAKTRDGIPGGRPC